MEVTIGPFAKMAGTTVRTLRYYDKIGLLCPKNYNENGNKIYTAAEWEKFQQINIYKHLGLSLSEIKEQMKNERSKNRELLLMQKQLILKKQEELSEILDVITRMERLYNSKGISDEDLDEFAFIMLDLFRREKSQIQSFEKHFNDDEQLMQQLNLLKDPEFKKKMDREIWNLLQAIKSSIQFNDSESRKKVQEILTEMDALFPGTVTFLNMTDDDIFITEHIHEFNNYFPEDIANYIYIEMKAYYEEKKNQIEEDY
ncbi:MerR family transcriptional regulator [Bacillus mesophilum]|uniref:MerR family transcriptional regulator n=1 Tax=Bacillus mesophilum TaxID=1071718 RepID=A0A7V7RJY8_9BACI|nr:MerR family transcriptional regulator [Bacillus mesophilum]KAB2331359.1 MerR family transcriptional regulator [Bacillus mesophilum]